MRFSVFNPDAERREGLKALLRQIDRRARFTDAPDWPSAERGLRRFPPNLFVVDWDDTMRRGELLTFVANYPYVPVAVLTDDTSAAGVIELLNEGARGIIPRTVTPEVIVRILEVVLLGGTHVPAEVLQPNSYPLMLPSVPRRGGSTAPATSRKMRVTGRLSPRQEQILRCVHMGSTNKMIARALGISEGTVKIHLASIFQLLGAPNRAAAVAIYNGWLSGQLQVLRSRADCVPHPARGEPAPVPLSARRARSFRYPLHVDDTEAELAIAAEPTIPFGESPAPSVAAPTEQAAEESPDDPSSATHSHVLSSNE